MLARLGQFRTWMLALLLLAACGVEEEREDLLARGEYLVLEGRWEEAIPVLRARLLEQPHDPGAHFYLGRAYMFLPDPMLFHAEGEFETALRLFHEQGGESPIERFSDEYFELACHLELSKVYLSLILMLLDTSGPVEVAERALERCEDNLEAARRIDPDSADVAALESHLEELRGIVEEPGGPGVRPRRRPDQPFRPEPAEPFEEQERISI